MGMYTNIQQCRISGSNNLIPILELGEEPLANALKKNPDDREDKFPLTLMYCPESSLVQLRETIDKEQLFSHYTWVTGTSPTTRDYATLFFQRVVEITNLSSDDLIIEIASNDGTFLIPFLQHGYHNVLGVDPAKNIATEANQRGVRTLDGFWGKRVAEETVAKSGNAKVVIARNVIPHVSELQDVIAGIGHILANDGIGIIEFHYAGQILQELHYDSIYHEHLCYFSIKSITYLLELYDLFPFHINLSPISGGSYVMYFSKRKRQHTNEYLKLLEKENLIGVNDIQKWEEFAKSCREHRKKSIDIAASFSSKTVLGYGASARSSTYLNFCGFDSAQINAIIDNNPLKQGMYSPGTSIPIVTLENGMQMNPDLIFILAWNFRDEIVKECRANGYKGEFLVPFPQSPYYLRD
jgi:SAM-dependent methyltransferase